MDSKDNLFHQKSTLNIRGNLVDVSSPKIMGILNITPDSFYQGSRQKSISETLDKAEQMISEGATFLDIGGYSTRPDADDISAEEETQRVIPMVQALSKSFPNTYISIDTFRANIARKAIDTGAHIINDVSGGNLDENMFATVAELGVPYVLMHMRGTPQNMNSLNNYENLLVDVTKELEAKRQRLLALGVKDIIIDPGFGFAKSISQNYEMLRNLGYFKRLNSPLLAGISRKSMIYKTLGNSATEALNGTTALNMTALMNGANILRVHDVKEASEVIELYKAYKG